MKEKDQNTEKTTEEVEEISLKGHVNTHEKALPPKFTTFENGNSHFAFSMVYKDNNGDYKSIDVVATNDIADRLYTSINGEGSNKFTVKGTIHEKENGYPVLRATQLQKHKILNVEGTINYVEDKGKYTNVLLSVPNEKNNYRDSMNIAVFKDQDLNQAELEKGKSLAVNGESSVFFHQNGTRSVSVKSWNLAPTMERLQEVLKVKKGPEQSNTVEMTTS